MSGQRFMSGRRFIVSCHLKQGESVALAAELNVSELVVSREDVCSLGKVSID